MKISLVCVLLGFLKLFSFAGAVSVHTFDYKILPLNQDGTYYIGGGGGTPYDTHEFGNPVQSIAVWTSGNDIVCINLEIYSSGTKFTLGQQPNRPATKSYTFVPGEHLIGNFVITGNGRGSNAGGFKFTTLLGTFSVGTVDHSDTRQYIFPFGNSYLMVFFGNSGLQVDSLGFIMMKPLISSRLVVGAGDYDQSLLDSKPPVKIRFGEFENSSTLPDKHDVTELVSHSDSFEWGVTESFSFTYEQTVSAGIPEVEGTSAKWKMAIGIDSTQKNTKVDITTSSIAVQINVPPCKRVEYTDTWFESTDPIPFTGHTEYDFKDGSTFVVTTKGLWKGVITSKVFTESKQYPLQNPTVECQKFLNPSLSPLSPPSSAPNPPLVSSTMLPTFMTLTTTPVTPSFPPTKFSTPTTALPSVAPFTTPPTVSPSVNPSTFIPTKIITPTTASPTSASFTTPLTVSPNISPSTATPTKLSSPPTTTPNIIPGTTLPYFSSNISPSTATPTKLSVPQTPTPNPVPGPNLPTISPIITPQTASPSKLSVPPMQNPFSVPVTNPPSISPILTPQTASPSKLTFPPTPTPFPVPVTNPLSIFPNISPSTASPSKLTVPPTPTPNVIPINTPPTLSPSSTPITTTPTKVTISPTPTPNVIPVTATPTLSPNSNPITATPTKQTIPLTSTPNSTPPTVSPNISAITATPANLTLLPTPTPNSTPPTVSPNVIPITATPTKFTLPPTPTPNSTPPTVSPKISPVTATPTQQTFSPTPTQTPHFS